MTHAEQAWSHLEKVESFTIGRPCTSTCRYGRKCGLNVTPALLMSAHEYSYGRKTQRMQNEDESYTYEVELPKKTTMQRWRGLAQSSISFTNDGNRAQVEHLTVCQLGPVCHEYWAAAYGIPRGTANTLLAEARAGRTVVDAADRSFAQQFAASLRSSESESAAAAEVTVQWWESWLTLEDQMPNEAAIQHRALVWQSVYDQEYIRDMEWWGMCRALSRSRWVELREVALRNLSLQYFGHVEGSPHVPLAMLTLVERPKHSNFGMCDTCAAAKEKWMKYRRCTRA